MTLMPMEVNPRQQPTNHIVRTYRNAGLEKFTNTVGTEDKISKPPPQIHLHQHQFYHFC